MTAERVRIRGRFSCYSWRHRVGVRLHGAVTAAARLPGSPIVDCRTGRRIGRALLIPWRGNVHLIGLRATVRPCFLPQKSSTVRTAAWGTDDLDARRTGLHYHAMKPIAFACLLALAATARAGEFEDLIAQRDGLVTELEKKPPVEEVLLRFPEGCDTDDMLVTLRRAGGKWSTAFVEVPGLQQSTMDEWRKFYNNTAGGCWRPNLRFTADPAGLELGAKRLTGTMDVAYKIDLLMRERQPTGQRIQWWDKFIPGGYTVPRKQSYTLDAEVKSDACLLELVLEDGVYWDPLFAGPPKGGKAPGPVSRSPIVVRMQVPSTRFTLAIARTPYWFPGFHEAATEGLKFEDGRITGTLVVWLHQDGWGPWGGGGKHIQQEGLPLTFRVNATLRNNALTGAYTGSVGGVLAGTHYMGHAPNRADEVVIPDRKFEGAISGRGGRLVTGRFVSKGDLEDRIGPIDGMILDDPIPLRAKVKLADNKPSAGNVGMVLHQIRALHLALQHYPLPYDAALAQTDMPAPVDANAAACLKLVPPVPATDERLPKPIAETVGDSPSLGVTPLPAASNDAPSDSNAVVEAVSVLPDDAAGWSFIPRWNVLGGFTQRVGLENNDGLLPDLPAVFDAWYAQPRDGMGAVRQNAPSNRWQRVSCNGPRLGVPWENAPFFVRFTGKVWYAAATVRTATARTIWLSLEANDFAKLWLNDRLVWVDTEKVWRYRSFGRAFVPVKLAAGDNRLLVRMHNDRKMAWLRLALSPVEPSTPRPPDKPGNYANPNIFPDANPPLAWNIEKGINVAWRNAGLAGPTRPVLAGDALLVTGTNGALHCLDAADGKERWATGPGKGPGSEPVTDGTRVWSHSGGLACYDLAGRQVWTQDTGMHGARVHLAGGLLVVEGEIASTGKGDPGALRVIVFDAKDGKERYRWNLPGRLGNKGMLLDTGAAIVYLTSTGVFLDVKNGSEMPLPDIEMQHTTDKANTVASNLTQWCYAFSRNADTFFLTSQERHLAVRFWEKGGRLGYAHAWESNYGHSGFGNVFAAALATDRFLFTTHSSLAHSPHAPDPRAEVNIQDVKTGRVLKRLKPAMDDLYAYGALNLMRPTIAGKHLFLHGARSDNSRTQINVITADEQLQPVANNDVDPGTVACPVFVGDRMILRSPSALTCLAVTSKEGLDYQNLALARAMLRYVGRQPVSANPQTIAGLDRISTAGDIPIGVLRNERTTEFWLGAGPLSAERLAALRLPDTNGIAFVPMDRDHAYNEPVMYLRTSELQGTGDITPHFKSDLDPRGNAGLEGAGVFYTVLDNTRDRVVVPVVKDKGVSQWLGGQELQADRPLHLKAGLYPYLVKVAPEYFRDERKPELPGVQVTNALAAGAIRDIGWPRTWKVIGPLPADAPPLTQDQLRTVPKLIAIGGVDYEPYDFPVEGDTVNLMALADTAPGRKPNLANPPRELKTTAPPAAYLFVEVECPADGYLYINAGGDWYMQWFVDGSPLHSEIREGFTAKASSHALAARVSKGRHVIAVMQKPGAQSWQMSSVGGFSEKSADEMPGFRVPARPLPPRDLRLNPSFREIPLPLAMETAWRERATRNRDRLQSVVRDLPGTEEAATAAAILSSL